VVYSAATQADSTSVAQSVLVARSPDSSGDDKPAEPLAACARMVAMQPSAAQSWLLPVDRPAVRPADEMVAPHAEGESIRSSAVKTLAPAAGETERALPVPVRFRAPWRAAETRFVSRESQARAQRCAVCSDDAGNWSWVVARVSWACIPPRRVIPGMMAQNASLANDPW